MFQPRRVTGAKAPGWGRALGPGASRGVRGTGLRSRGACGGGVRGLEGPGLWAEERYGLCFHRIALTAVWIDGQRGPFGGLCDNLADR